MVPGTSPGRLLFHWVSPRVQEMCLFCYQKPKLKWQFYCILPHLHLWEGWWRRVRVREQRKGYRFLILFQICSHFLQSLWFCGLRAGVEVWIYFAILLFLSNLFEIIHCIYIEAFEYRSQEFRVFALQPHQRTGPRWMTAHMSRPIMGTGGKKKN